MKDEVREWVLVLWLAIASALAGAIIALLATGATYSRYDLNRDGKVDLKDASIELYQVQASLQGR